MTIADPVWEEIFRVRMSWNRYPSEELIRFFAANYYAVQDRKSTRVLEVGCGPGGGASLYVAREGFSYFGIDGSPTAITKARETFAQQQLVGDFQVGSILQLPYESNSFDCVIDLCCLQCNSEVDAAGAIGEIARVLKKGGRHFSLTTMDKCWGSDTGERIDATSRRNVTEGPYVGMGIIRFATLASVQSLYSSFKNLHIEHLIRSVEDRKHEINHWFLSAEK